MKAGSMRQQALAFLVGLPLFALLGLWLIARSVLRAPRALRSFRAALARELRCPNGHPNAVSGRWECASCKAVYMGWVGRCTLCGAGAAWFPCIACGVSIRLPWERGQ